MSEPSKNQPASLEYYLHFFPFVVCIVSNPAARQIIIVHSVVTPLCIHYRQSSYLFWVIAHAHFNVNNIFVNICVKKMEFDTEQEYLVRISLGSLCFLHAVYVVPQSISQIVKSLYRYSKQ
jgi:hypothetical protein